MLSLLIAVAAIIAFGLYYFFRTSSPTSPTDTPTAIPTAPGQLPSAGIRATTTPILQGGTGSQLPLSGIITTTPSVYRPEAVTQLSSDFASSASVNSNGTYRYHNELDGKFYSIDSTGKITELVDNVFFNVSNVTWAPTKNIAVIEYPDDSKIIYNFDKNTQVTLPKHWKEFSFSSDSSEIAAKSMGLTPESRYLVTTRDDGTGTKIIANMGNNSQFVDINWSPSRQVVAFSQTGQPQGGDRREVLMVGLNGENFKSLIVEGSNFESNWSTTGRKLAYSVNNASSDYKPQLWVVDSYGDSIGDNRQLLNINTWAEKCTFASDTTLFCGVPRTLPTGAGINKNIANSTYDDLYKIDLTNGLKTPISLGSTNYTIKDISYNKTKNKLLITDINQIGIFEVNL